MNPWHEDPTPAESALVRRFGRLGLIALAIKRFFTLPSAEVLMASELDELESHEQGAGGFIQDEHGAVQPLYEPRICVVKGCATVRRHGEFTCADHRHVLYVPEKPSLGGDRGEKCFRADCGNAAMPGSDGCVYHTSGSIAGMVRAPLQEAQPIAGAFHAGGELMRMSYAVADVKQIVTRHEAALQEMSAAIGKFRDQVMVPIKKELEFLRYNLGDKANATVSQMQGILQHFHLLYEGILKQAGFDERGIAAIKEELGIPANLPSLELLESAGRPAVDAAAIQASMEALAAQNQRLLNDAGRREEKHQQQIAQLMERLAKLETPGYAPEVREEGA